MRGLKNSMALARACREIGGVAVVFSVVLAALASTASAQAPKRTVIRAGHVLDVRTGELRANQAIVISATRSSRSHRPAKSPQLPGDTTIDLPDATLLPGLIDMHTHLTFDLNSLGYQGLSISTAREALHGATQCAADARSRFHHRAKPRRERLCGHRPARRHQ